MEHSNSNQVGSMSAAGSARIQIGNNPTIHNTTYNYSQDGDAKYLAALCSTDPRHDKIRIEQTNGGLLKDSYRWVLQNPDYQRWRDPTESWPLLWIRGDAGKGKTMLLSGIIDELQPFTRLADPTSHTSLSYFFCQATNPGLNSATAVLRGLVYLLVDQQRCLLSHVRDKTSLGPEHWNSGVATREILSKILEDPTLQNTILVVDALDECITDLELLLQVVISTSSPKVRWLVSSRNISEIEQHLDQAQTRVALSLELNAESVSQAVNSYIHYRVHQLSVSKGFRSDDLKFAEDYLSHNAHGTFLWVALVCQQLEKSEPWEVRAYLELFPAGLNRLYERMMDLICSPVSSGLYMRILAIICTVFRPITLSELMAIEDLPGDEDMLPKMIMKCGCFLTVRDKVVYFVHQSAKDFLLKQQGALFPTGLPQHHLHLFHKSLKGLEILKMDIYDLVHPSVSVEEALLNRPEPDPLSGLAYFCQFWAHHLRDALPVPAQDASHCNGVHQFIARKLLFWLEALSLYRNLPAAMVALQILQNLPLVGFRPRKALACLSLMPIRDQGSDAVALVEDSCRFFLYFRPVIEVHPLQIYMSGLLFSPEESLIRRHFEQYSPKYVVAKPQAEKQWRPSEHINNLSLSSQGRLLVWSSSSLLFIRDLTHKKLRHMIVAEGSILHLAVSNDESSHSQWVVSITRKDIHVWNATTKALQWSLKRPWDLLTSSCGLQFSNDQHVVLRSGLFGEQLIHYNIKNSTPLLLTKLKKRGIGFCSDGFAISPDSHWLACQADSGNQIAIFEKRTGIQRGLLNIPTAHLFFLDNSTILTDQGCIAIDTYQTECFSNSDTRSMRTETPSFVGYAVSGMRDWITLDGIRLVWLPPQYRAKEGSRSAVGERHVGIRSNSRLYFIRFSQGAKDLLRQARQRIVT